MSDSNKNRIKRILLNIPYGQMETMATSKGLVALEFRLPKRSHLLEKRLAKWFPDYEIEDVTHVEENDVLYAASQWLEDYFAGRFNQLKRPPLDLRGTEFELKVWHGLLDIPLGETWSYGELAAHIGNPNASRAVGGTNRRNPVAIIVPCHRVIGQNGKLVGYGGGLDLKHALLEHEKRLENKVLAFN